MWLSFARFQAVSHSGIEGCRGRSGAHPPFPVRSHTIIGVLRPLPRDRLSRVVHSVWGGGRNARAWRTRRRPWGRKSRVWCTEERKALHHVRLFLSGYRRAVHQAQVFLSSGQARLHQLRLSFLWQARLHQPRGFSPWQAVQRRVTRGLRSQVACPLYSQPTPRTPAGARWWTWMTAATACSSPSSSQHASECQ